jgi:hypothetical protein
MYLPTFNFASLENFQVGSQQVSSQNIKGFFNIVYFHIIWSIAKFGWIFFWVIANFAISQKIKLLAQSPQKMELRQPPNALPLGYISFYHSNSQFEFNVYFILSLQ